VLRAYGQERLTFGPEYIIPKPFDPRVLIWEASAVARTAEETGVARQPMSSEQAYREKLEASLSRSHHFLSGIRHKARGRGKRIIFSDGEHDTIIRAVHIIQEESLGTPVLVGDPAFIGKRARNLAVKLDAAEIIDPRTHADTQALARFYYDKRQRRGVTWADADYYASRPDWFASLMLETGRVDGMVAGISRSHPFVMRALLEVIPLRADVERVSGLFILLTKHDVFFLADCTTQIQPTAEQMAETAILTADVAAYFNQTPKVAMVSYSNFGSVNAEESRLIRRAIEIVRERRPELCIDGEMQADTAVSPEIQRRAFPFCKLEGRANVLIFPNLTAANTAVKLLDRIGSAEAIGPLSLGFSRPVNVLHPTCDVEDVVNATAITVIECLDGTL